MTNQELLQKMKEDMEMRGFSYWTKESYELKAKDTMRYFKKPMEEVTIEEFIRRFLLHILPPHFMKIRYYGILRNRAKKKKLGNDFNLCPHCHKGHMLISNSS